MKSYRYSGQVSGSMPGVGYVETGKVIEVTTQAQVDAIEKVLEADRKAKREPSFEVYDGRVTTTNRAAVPLEAFGVYPEPDESAEAPLAKQVRTRTPRTAAEAAQANTAEPGNQQQSTATKGAEATAESGAQAKE